MESLWSDVWSRAVEALLGAARPRTPAAEKLLRRMAEARRKRLAALMTAWADALLDEATLQAELQEERRSLRMEYEALEGLDPGAARAGANALLDVIEDALLDGIVLD